MKINHSHIRSIAITHQTMTYRYRHQERNRQRDSSGYLLEKVMKIRTKFLLVEMVAFVASLITCRTQTRQMGKATRIAKISRHLKLRITLQLFSIRNFTFLADMMAKRIIAT